MAVEGQLEYIINYLGTPTKEDLEATSGNERASKYAASLGNGSSNNIPHYFQQHNPQVPRPHSRHSAPTAVLSRRSSS